MPKPSANRLTIRRVPAEDVFELVHPPCVDECALDIEAVHAMLAAGEADVAIDELRWLLEQCPELLEAHMLLGRIALADGDVPLARGHFGQAFELGLEALPKSGSPPLLPFARPANQPFLQAAQGLAQCYQQSGEPDLAAEVVNQLLALDPTDPLHVKDLLTDDA